MVTPTTRLASLASLNDYELVLASKSPRRSELLSLLGVQFSVIVPADVDESYPADMPAEQVPEYLARIKAQAYLDTLYKPRQLVIAADTVVICDGKVLGKPHDADEAREMLLMLAGKTHRVVSGVAVTAGDEIRSFSSATDVTFDHLTELEINDYVTHYAPFDKAGAYGIQEWIGAVAICGIKGSFYNVMGLPVHPLYKLLSTF